MGAIDTSILSQMAGTVGARVAELRAKSFAELKALPKVETGSIAISGKPIMLSVYRTSRPSQELLVVVQALRPRPFGVINQVLAEGFLASANGEKSDAPEQLLWEYT